MRETFGQVATDLQAQAAQQLSGREQRWRFEQRQGPIAEQLTEGAAAPWRVDSPAASQETSPGRDGH